MHWRSVLHTLNDERRRTVLKAAASAGAMSQNVHLCCACAGLATVIRTWIDRDALSRAMRLGDETGRWDGAMRLGDEHRLLLSQTVRDVRTP